MLGCVRLLLAPGPVKRVGVQGRYTHCSGELVRPLLVALIILCGFVVLWVAVAESIGQYQHGVSLRDRVPLQQFLRNRWSLDNKLPLRGNNV